MDTKQNKKMGKVIGITFTIALILGLSLGFIIGAGTVVYIGKNMAEDFINDSEIKIMPALIFDLNKSTIKDYTKGLINTSEIIDTSEIKETIMNKINNYGDK